jgi:hypothetical protein
LGGRGGRLSKVVPTEGGGKERCERRLGVFFLSTKRRRGTKAENFSLSSLFLPKKGFFLRKEPRDSFSGGRFSGGRGKSKI